MHDVYLNCGSLKKAMWNIWIVNKNKPFDPAKLLLTNSGKSRQARLQEDTYFRVLKILSDNPQIKQRELSKHLGLSLGGVNYCLTALIEKGFIKAQNFNASKRKLGYAYMLTPKGVGEKATLLYSFLQRKMREYEDLKVEIERQRNALLDAHLGSQIKRYEWT